MTADTNSETWSVADAKARLSEVLRRAREEGPQRIGKRDAVIVLSEAEWLRLQATEPPLGRWLVDNAPRASEGDPPFVTPNRHARAGRPTPFIDYASEDE